LAWCGGVVLVEMWKLRNPFLVLNTISIIFVCHFICLLGEWWWMHGAG